MTEKQLYNYAIWLLARRRYHSAELRQKLEKRSKRFAASNSSEEGAVTQTSSSVIPALIDKLTGYGYLNDDEYMKLFIEDQISRKAQGPRLIRQKLLRKGIDSTQIAIHLSHANIDQLSLAKKAASKKIIKLKPTDPTGSAKLMRFLHGRGFDFSTIKQVLKSAQE